MAEFEGDEMEALKTLHGGQLQALTLNAERAFSATLQCVTLNVISLGGLIAAKLTLQVDAKILGSVVLIMFNFLVCNYLYFKDVRYQIIKSQLLIIENALIEKSPSIRGKIIIKNKKRYSTLTGTGLFIIAIIISCLCTVFALWRPLIKNLDTPVKSITTKATIK